ncbi:TIR domain-containing protein [Azohydromonas australica]|uniref:TIR domain-containing protein n=1 Tax=Azohydromonas australica TaxID=364039 RepID=UPI0003FBCDA1|nr:TIR domain-containing protein [Azohydromonas australica]
MSLKQRFESQSTLINALRAQKIVQGDTDVATAFANAGELVEFAPGQNLIVEGDSDRDMYFLLAGKVHVIVKDARLYPREKNVTVGEMSAINAEITRAATIQANEPTVALKVSHETLDAIGHKHPSIWRLLAIELSGRLEQRNQFINRPNAKPRVFFICSSEALDIAECIRAGLQREDAIVQVWSDDHIFSPGGYPIEALERAVSESDFGIAIAQPDDLIRSRDRQSSAPRDNVIFELGFFMSRLGRARTLLLVPSGEDVKLPSDFKGLTPLSYKEPSADEEPATALGPVTYRIKQHLRKLGVRKPLQAEK